MRFELGPASEIAGYTILAFDTVGSTNAEALTQARLGESGPLWIAARHQSAGRGRRGRVWETPEGNLAASLLVTLDVARPLASTLGFVAGLSLNQAIAWVAPDARLSLKWPNDVLADGAKIAGILLEVAELAESRLAIAIGIGVNVVAAPEGLPYLATSLRVLGAETTAEALFSALADAWLQFYALWDAGRGLAEIRHLWLAQAAGLGAPVAVRLGESILRGTFETLDEEGRLIVITEDGARQAVAAGEVHFGDAASVVVP